MPNVRRILSLDLATRIGFAIGDIGKDPEFGAHLLPSTGEDIGKFLDAFHEFLNRFMAAKNAPDLIVFEAPILPRQTSFKTVRKLGALGAFLEWRCHCAGVQVREMHNADMKKFWAGGGGAKKAQMVEAARRWGYPIQDFQEDEADALAGFWFAVYTIAPQHARRFV